MGKYNLKKQIEKDVWLLEAWREAKEVLKLYDVVDIFFLNRQKGRVKVLSDFETKKFSFGIFKKLWWKHVSKREEVVFVPKTNYKIAFVDDPSADFWNKITAGTVVVETSKNKYQLHIPLPTTFEEQARLMQRCFAEFFRADYVAWNQPRKLAGFLNYKYEKPQRIKIVKHNSERLNIELLKDIDELWEKFKPQYCPDTKRKSPDTAPLKTTPLKRWIDFHDGDESVADIKYAVYLFSRGYSYDEVKEALLRESLDIEKRKQGHLEDYLRRTLAKALDYSQRTFQPPKRP